MAEKGYAIAFDSGYLVIRDIPYLDHSGQLQTGAFVTKLEFVDQNRVIQQDHQVFFAGGIPYQLDGTRIPNLAGGETQLTLSDKCADIVVQRSFSNKPKSEGRFVDFLAKIESYTAIIAGPAIDRYGISPFTFRVDPSSAADSVFKFQDSLTSRAEITDLSAKFKNDVVAVIGLGGTGGYLLDYLVKTPVSGIKAFDLDPYHVHNAFRSPGRLLETEFGKPKSEVYAERYDNFRCGLSFTPKFLDSDCSEDLDGVTFAFVCVDKGSSRAAIFEILIAKGIPFIDVGMGLKRKTDTLSGQARVTYYPPEHAVRMRDMQLSELNDGSDNIYRSNVQIAELNALNASLAVIRYKQLRGFYEEEKSLLHLLFRFQDLTITGEEIFDEI
jgi:hypothetical protein